MAKAQPWLKDLRSVVRRQHGAGWVLEGENDRFKIQKIEGPRKGARRPTVRTQIRFTPSSVSEIINLVDSIKSKMDELNLDLATAYSLAAKNSETKEQGSIKGWEKIADEYKNSRIGSGEVKESNYGTNEKYKIDRVLKLINAPKNAAHDGKQVIEKYNAKYLKDVPTGGRGRVTTFGDLKRFLKFAVKDMGADTKWLPPAKEEISKLIGKRTKANPKNSTIPVKPDQLFKLLDSLYEKPELRLAVALVGLYGLRPAELMALKVEDGNLYVGHVKRNQYTNVEAQQARRVMALDLKELPKEGEKVLKQFASGEVKLPPAILSLQDEKAMTAKNEERAKAVDKDGNPKPKPPLSAFKECGHRFKQYLDRHPYWQSLVKEIDGLTPYGLRHGFAWRGAKYYPRSIPPRDLAALMGHDPVTHQRHYGKWTDEADIALTVESITGGFNEKPLSKLMPTSENYLKKVGKKKLRGAE